MKKALVIIIVMCVASVNAVTVSYWELDGAAWNGSDSVGTHDLTAVGANTDSGLRVDPIPNPDLSPWSGTNSASSNPKASWFGTDDVWYSPNSGVEEQHDSTFDFDPGKAFTVEGWFRAFGSGTVVGNRHYNASHQYAGNYKGWSVYTTGGGSTLNFYVDGAAASGYSRNITAAVTAQELHHFAAVYDPDGFTQGIGQTYLYVDGVLQGTAVAASQWSWHRGGSLAIGGRDVNGTLTSLMMNGEIDEIRYSDTVLPPEYFLNGDTPVPEPATMALLVLGGLFLRKRK